MPGTNAWRPRRRWLAAMGAGVLVLSACADDGPGTDAGAQQAEPLAADASVDDATETTVNSTAELEAQLEALEAMFPIEVDASIDDFDLVGGYTMSLTEAYCDGFDTCGTRNPDFHADIIQGQNGLELQIPNVATTGLFDVEGSLFGVTNSDQFVEPCGATPRDARVSTTIFADGVTIDIDGTRTLSGLGASLLVEAAETPECGEGVVFFAAQLTPDGG